MDNSTKQDVQLQALRHFNILNKQKEGKETNYNLFLEVGTMLHEKYNNTANENYYIICLEWEEIRRTKLFLESTEIIELIPELDKYNIYYEIRESDLYIPVTENSIELVSRYKFKDIIDSFFSEGRKWFDIPFAAFSKFISKKTF